MDVIKKAFLAMLQHQGIVKVRGMIKDGKIKKEVPVDLEAELASVKKEIEASSEAVGMIATLNVSDDDLRKVCRKVIEKSGLKLKV